MARRMLLIIAIGVSMFALASPATAQTRQIEYGTFTIASLDQNVQGGFFNFTASEGDFISVEAVALSGSLNPRVTLLNASSTTLAVNSDDPFQPGISDARLTYEIATTSSYTILVEAENGTEGQYLLRVERQDLPPATPLGVGVITTANVSPEVPAQVFTFDSATGTRVAVSSPGGGFPYVAEVYTPDGQLLAIHSGSQLQGGSTAVPNGTGIYKLIIRSGGGVAAGSVDVEFSSGAAPTQQAESPAPATTEGETIVEEEAAPPPADAGTSDTDTAAAPPTPVPEEAAPPPTDDTSTDTAAGEADDTEAEDEGTVGAETVGAGIPTDRCNVSPSAGGVVIREGPSTDFPAIASIPQGEFRFAEATDGAWIRLVGDGWVSSGVVDLNGPCGSLPLENAPRSPDAANEAAAPEPTATTLAPPGQR